MRLAQPGRGALLARIAYALLDRAGREVARVYRRRNGDQRALERLTPIVYDELHRLAGRYMKRERPGHTLQTTALVNEAYVRLVRYTRMRWQDRAHFFAVAAQVMRRILVEHARRHNLRRDNARCRRWICPAAAMRNLALPWPLRLPEIQPGLKHLTMISRRASLRIRS